MNTHALLASFAVAATVAAAELKDPAEVARQFNEAGKPALPLGGSADLRASGDFLNSPLPRPDSSARLTPKSKRPSLVPYWGPIPRDKIYDAPNYRVPEVLPDNMPPGTKEWKYGGGTYYLLPLIPAREK
jgi:hypothetical protein